MRKWQGRATGSLGRTLASRLVGAVCSYRWHFAVGEFATGVEVKFGA